MIRSSNPTLNDKTFDFGSYERAASARGEAAASDAMTLNGTAFKTFNLLCLLVIAAAFTWWLATPATGVQPNPDGTMPLIDARVMPWVIGGAIGGFIVAIILIFKQSFAPILAPVYAILEGLFLGGISAMFEAAYPGIVMSAAACTMGTLGALLLVYMTGLIKPSENFKLGIAAATGGIMLVYLVSIVLRFVMPDAGFLMIHEAGIIGIGFSIFVIIIAALNLVLDFDFIEEGVARGAPKYMEWFAAFGLLVTLIWLYIEFLRLLAKLRSGD